METDNDANAVVIFVHGSPGSLDAFIHFLTDSILLQRAVLVSVDRPGFGQSNFGVAEPSLHQQGELLMPLLNRYKKENKSIFLVGHSLGGPLIARMAIDHPDLVDDSYWWRLQSTPTWNRTKHGFALLCRRRCSVGYCRVRCARATTRSII
ncbi:MAG: alpha/beta hydrolase [Bacteroidia bacterium]|nr:alpha/beta hydrolase [Bacteroidia bacterium]